MIATRVLATVPELTAQIVRLIVAQETTYRAAGTVPLEVLSQSVDGNIRRILESLAGVQRPPEEELAVARTTGRRRAQQGVPLEAVLRAYRLATQLILKSVLTEARGGSQEDPAAFLVEATTAVLGVVDRHSEAVVEGYRKTEAELQRRDSQRQQAVFDALLEGHGADPRMAGEALAVLGLPPSGPYVVVVSTFDVAAHQTLSATQDACAAYFYDAAWRIRGDREIGIVALAQSPVPRLLGALRPNAIGRIGISDAFDALHEVPEAHRSAEIALQTVTPDGAQVVWIAERLPEALLFSSPALAARLARRALGPVLALPAEEQEVLLETLDAWYQNDRSVSREASQLYCHRNTILNRLHRIEGLCGRSLEDHRYLLACYLALLTLRHLSLPPSRG
ncbi:helix-turn-helix domain-containing protein [Kitasatospora kifunensis]